MTGMAVLKSLACQIVFISRRRGCMKRKLCLTWLISVLIWLGADPFATDTSDQC